MNVESKKRMLAAFDALSAVQTGSKSDRPPNIGELVCDACGEAPASCGAMCPVGQSIRILMRVVPRWPDRERWLNQQAK